MTTAYVPELDFRWRDLAKRLVIARVNQDTAAHERTMSQATRLAADLAGDNHVNAEHTTAALASLLDSTLHAIARTAPSRVQSRRS